LKDVSIVLCGEAGQGIQTVEQLLVGIFKLSGYHVFATKEYMSRIRGGTNSTELRIGSKRVAAYVDKIDILIPLSNLALEHLKRRITTKTIIIGEKRNIKEEYCVNKDNVFFIDFTNIAEQVGGKLFSNIISVGVFTALLNADKSIAEEYLKVRFAKKGEKIVSKNIDAFNEGYRIGLNLKNEGKISIDVEKDPSVIDEILFNGNQGVAMGALAGGCNFISAYPMSPSTGVLVFLSQHARDFGIVVDQAEDEIAAMNKALGAWFAGARAIASTSGGGFALMQEAMSLAGMIESPVVIHVAQRPGPATGLPTRTGQEDLLFTLRSGHGEFARVIYAPGSINDAFELTQKAFNVADKFQIPVFVLTDEYLVDMYYNIPNIDFSEINVDKQFVKTNSDYQRYKFTENGLSPRGIPGYGDGLVRVDSDEHDEDGFISEDVHDIRPKMVQKRFHKKLNLLRNEIIEPRLIGSTDYKHLVVAWGSTYGIIKEAVESLARKDIALLHFTQVYPLNHKIVEHLEKADQVIFMENNAGAQFATIVNLETGFNIEDKEKVHKLLKYNGMPFSVEEVTDYLRKF
jgi:2-oxoglutarate ferredoxin oxidoreductase subunit alpha